MFSQFEIVTTTAGAISIRDNIVNEIMHNPVGPWVEANELYIEQSQLEHRLIQEPFTNTLVVFDIGLGAAANALATLHCARKIHSSKRNLKVISFEKDLELLRFALKNAKCFAHFEGFEKAVEAILTEGRWSENSIEWELRQGDFIEAFNFETERPHIIFFDPYSPKSNPEAWTMNCFQKLFSLRRSDLEGGTMLYTYSQATPVRAAMLASGFFVGHGKKTGLKSETTEASTLISTILSPLSQRWLTRWKHSDTPLPFDCLPDQAGAIRHLIAHHPQFRGLSL